MHNRQILGNTSAVKMGYGEGGLLPSIPVWVGGLFGIPFTIFDDDLLTTYQLDMAIPIILVLVQSPFPSLFEHSIRRVPYDRKRAWCYPSPSTVPKLCPFTSEAT